MRYFSLILGYGSFLLRLLGVVCHGSDVLRRDKAILLFATGALSRAWTTDIIVMWGNY